MQIILLSGGSGTRLWPLSNDARSKQFLRVLDIDGTDRLESMVQRVHRQLLESGIKAEITVATSASQVDSVIAQLGKNVTVVEEPSRRDTFPAISLACEYLSKEKHCPENEVVVVMPCDPYTEAGYFKTIEKMAKGIEENKADIIVMGINPTYPSAKYGYILPDRLNTGHDVVCVKEFIEKPPVTVAEQLITKGALWNGGVFAFQLGYVTRISHKYNDEGVFSEITNHYSRYPKISFDYEVAEKAENIGMVKYDGEWKDLGTWNTLTDELKHETYGNVITDGTGNNTHIFNELNIPLLCMGTENLVVAASPDGIIVSEKKKSENVKTFASELKHRPMYEERRWGSYRVLDYIDSPDGPLAITKQKTINPGCSIDVIKQVGCTKSWTIVEGSGILNKGGKESVVSCGDVIEIDETESCQLSATTILKLIEVQIYHDSMDK